MLLPDAPLPLSPGKMSDRASIATSAAQAVQGLQLPGQEAQAARVLAAAYRLHADSSFDSHGTPLSNPPQAPDRLATLSLRTPRSLPATYTRMAWLAAVCGHDVVVGKLFESHLDAVAIVGELAPHALVSCDGALWGVWAAEGPGRVEATQHAQPQSAMPDGAADIDTNDSDDNIGWTLSGRKSWCSGAADVDGALVTARLPDGASRLFFIDMASPGVRVTAEGWDAVGMGRTGSVDVLLDRVPAVPIGAAGDYVARPGFWHGAAGIAACWYGAAAAVGEAVRQRAADLGPEADMHLLAHLGAIDAALHGARCALVAAGEEIDRCRADTAVPAKGAPLFGQHEALRVRALVEAAATETLARAGRALGAAPLCRNAAHARRVADLGVFLRQSHAERDLAEIGRAAANRKRESAWAL